VLRLQVCLEDVEVVVKPLQVLPLDCGDALQDLPGVEGGLWAGEGVGGCGWGLAFNEDEVVHPFSEALHVGSGDLEVNLLAP
jgi:hypothetical protein